jgi:Ras-related protein Rab-7A
LQIWDTAGTERYNSMGQNFYRNSVACVLVFDLTVKDTFTNIDNWRKEFMTALGPKEPDTFPFVLVGNKSDMDDLRVINQEDGENLSEQFGLKFYETSCKNGNNVEKCFKDLAKELYEVLKLNEEKLNREGNDGSNKNSDKKVILDEKKISKKKKCC